ncbi:hypothetical protein J2S74_002848 [Evansella vedderi]|uniref:50S ribosomal protein L29 n=1 Tax=Evansella vedderi TaxID=38282 RepID=A0ABT9ZW60_9BACI|nr:hypothetical protein [Evansella vedderi]MDQ0255466.1 hypothetical protein [Evansella vedderi]
MSSIGKRIEVKMPNELSKEELLERLAVAKTELKLALENFEFETVKGLKEDIATYHSELKKRKDKEVRQAR